MPQKLQQTYATWIVVFTAFIMISKANARTPASPPTCVHLDELIHELSESEHRWTYVSNLDVKGAEVTRGFEREALKHFYSKKHSAKQDEPYPFTVEQEGCSKIYFIGSDGKKEGFKISSSSRYHLDLIPEKKGPSLLYGNDENAKIESIRYKVKRFEGRKVLEKVMHVEFSIPNHCEFKGRRDQAKIDRQTASEEKVLIASDGNETHVVEVSAIESWRKPVQLRRFVSEKMLQLLSELASEYSARNSAQFLSCDILPPSRSLSSIPPK